MRRPLMRLLLVPAAALAARHLQRATTGDEVAHTDTADGVAPPAGRRPAFDRLQRATTDEVAHTETADAVAPPAAGRSTAAVHRATTCDEVALTETADAVAQPAAGRPTAPITFNAPDRRRSGPC